MDLSLSSEEKILVGNRGEGGGDYQKNGFAGAGDSGRNLKRHWGNGTELFNLGGFYGRSLRHLAFTHCFIILFL